MCCLSTTRGFLGERRACDGKYPVCGFSREPKVRECTELLINYDIDDVSTDDSLIAMMDQFTVVADQRIYNNNCRFLKGSLNDAFSAMTLWISGRLY